MFRYLLALLAITFATPSVAQDSSATGLGVGIGTGISSSQSGAVSASGVVFNTPSNSSAAIRQSGTTTVRNVPGVIAPGLAAAGIETCLGSVSAGGAGPGFGFSFGSTVTDKGCDARLDSRTLWAFGLKNEAVARLCQKEEIRAAMPERCGVQTAAAGPAAVQRTAVASPGRVLLTEGKTGKDRWCLNYDEVKRRCNRWE